MVAMHLTGSFHPPADIDPLVVVVNDMSWSFLIVPVGIGALLLATFAFAWHNLVTRAPMKTIPGPSGGGDPEALHIRCVLSRESMPMSLVGTKPKCRLPLRMSANRRWSQPVDATLYLRGKRWSVGWNEDFIEGLLRQRRRSYGIAGSAGSR
jgi:hypothetical protein